MNFNGKERGRERHRVNFAIFLKTCCGVRYSVVNMNFVCLYVDIRNIERELRVEELTKLSCDNIGDRTHVKKCN